MFSLAAHERRGVWRHISRLAVPLLVAESLNFAVQLGVVAILGRMGGEAVYLRSLYQPVSFAVLALCVGFGVCNQVAAAISKGAGRPRDVMANSASLARVWLGIGAALYVILAVAAPSLTGLLHVDAELRGTFVSFLRWTSAAGLLAVGAELCASGLRGYGYVRQATVLVLCTASVRIGLVAGLGLGAGIGIAAVPVAEGAAGLTGLAMGLVLLRRTELWHPPAVRIWRREVLTDLRRIGVPIAVSLLVISAYNLAVVGVLAGYGENAVAGYTVASTLQNVVLLPGTVLGTATAITINQQRGAGDWPRIRASMRGGIEVTVVTYAVVAVLVWSVHDPLARLIAGDARVAAEAGGYLGAVALTYAIQGPVLASLTVMEETGGGLRAIVLNAIYFGLIVAVSAAAAHAAGSADGFYAAVAYCNLIGVTVPLVAVRHIRALSARGGAQPVAVPG
ncbi:MATE family efflux transporter [Actinacidiphila rubida]|uniref:Probable multidrug resistance protein NorM n=1 Tax=Actinacidiphila rubida TaxID=310780 RepID=A0A1H8TL20_9ACTN|nr:MATE family efflux transporter [Actinacidiphila rubida]SEO91759.1 Na+-driven multidrug efflux pump [Actinacidiphila rubida]